MLSIIYTVASTQNNIHFVITDFCSYSCSRERRFSVFCSCDLGLNKTTQQMPHPKMGIFLKCGMCIDLLYIFIYIYILQAVMGQIQKKDWWSIFLIQPTTTNWSDQRLMVQNSWPCSWWSRWPSSSVWSVSTFVLSYLNTVYILIKVSLNCFDSLYK